ncbi:hypothetical protein [Streptomyces olivaceoviridis]
MSPSPDHLARARAADSDRRRTRVLKVLDKLAADGEEITVSSVARAAGVHRSLIHRHGDLHAAVLARAGEPPPGATAGTQVSRQSLLAAVANLTARNFRLSVHITRLERRLSEALGQAAWEASGLGAPADVETLTGHRVGTADPRSPRRTRRTGRGPRRRRAANRGLMAQLNR